MVLPGGGGRVDMNHEKRNNHGRVVAHDRRSSSSSKKEGRDCSLHPRFIAQGVADRNGERETTVQLARTVSQNLAALPVGQRPAILLFVAQKSHYLLCLYCVVYLQQPLKGGHLAQLQPTLQEGNVEQLSWRASSPHHRCHRCRSLRLFR